jgi:hypothetical protein
MAFPNLTGIVTLGSPLKSSEFGAILWLISRRCGHERAGRTGDRGIGKSRQTGHPNRTLAGRPLAANLGRCSRHEISKQLDWISIKSAGNRNKFNDINTPLAAFVFGNKRLRPAKFFG